MQDASHIDPSTPLIPLPLDHWRGLMREQAERNGFTPPRNFPGAAGLTADDIEELVWRYQHEPHVPMREIALDYGISRSWATRIAIRELAR